MASFFGDATRRDRHLYLLGDGARFLERCDRLGHRLDVFVDGVDGVLVVDGFDDHVRGGVLRMWMMCDEFTRRMFKG